MTSDIDPNALIWLAIAAINITPATVAAVYAMKAHAAARRAEELTLKVEVATNSMKDALVVATGAAALAEGREIGRAEGITKAAALAEGRLAAQETLPP